MGRPERPGTRSLRTLMAMVTQAKHNLRAMSEENEEDPDLRTPGWSETCRQTRY
jgi:hypothetical protein